MAYDAMGNYIGYEDYSTPVAPVTPVDMETEEQRRKREEEERKRREKEAKRADETAVQEQKVITYENGSKTIETKQEIPAGGKIQPIAPSYNQRIAREESGNKPNIGFHDRNKSTAYGTYGMTSAAYQDARRRDPNLPEDITQATPEQQTQAQDAFTQQNAGYLKNYGIEPTENNLAAAHFLGAKGLRDYLETGRISDAAARANGGADNVKRIVDQRLSGQAAPASGAAQQRPQQQVQPVDPTFARPQAQPGPGVAVATGQGVQGTTTPVSPEQAQVQAQQQVSRDVVNPDEAAMAQDKAQNFLQTQTAAIGRYTEAQNDPAALMKMGTDENVPEMLRDRARNRAADLITQQREQARAQEDLGKKSPNELARMMTERKKDGSWGKYILFGALGMTALRDEEAQKLGIGTDRIVTDAEGKSYLVKVGANGAPIEGFDSEGRALTPEKMIQAMGAGQAMKGVNQGQEVYKDPSGVVKGSFVLETRPGRMPVYKEVGTGRIATDAESAVLSKIGVAGTLEQQAAAQTQKLNIDLEGDWAKASIEIAKAGPKAAAEEAGKFNFKYGTNFTPEQFRGMAPQINSQGRVTMAPAQAAPTQAAPAQAGKVQPVVPGSPEAQAAPTPGATTSAPIGQTPADTESARKRREEQEKVERELGQKSSEGVIKYRDEQLVPSAAGGQQGSDIVRRQFAVMNDPRSNALFGLMNKAQSMSTSDKNWAVVRDVLAGKIDSREGANLPAKWVETNLDPDQKSLLETMKADTAALATATIKSGGFGTQVTDRDRISAEKMQLDIGEVPALGMFQGKAQQLFNFDMSRAKSDWAATKNFAAVDQLERAWRKEQATLVEQYGKIADERNAFIKANSDGKPATIGLVRDAYRRYPVPQYDPNLNGGEGGWKNLRKRDLNEILKGNR